MTVPNYDWRCSDEECGVVFIEFAKWEDRDNPLPCQACAAPANMSPNMPSPLKASWPDGYRRKNQPEWQRMRETSKLKLEHANQSDSKGDRDKVKDQIDLVNGKRPPKKRKRPSELMDK